MKNETIHFRVSPEEKATVYRRAKEAGFSSVSNYMVDILVYRGRYYNPMTMIRLENIRSILNEAAPGVSQECKDRFKQEVNELWKSLNS